MKLQNQMKRQLLARLQHRLPLPLTSASCELGSVLGREHIELPTQRAVSHGLEQIHLILRCNLVIVILVEQHCWLVIV